MVGGITGDADCNDRGKPAILALTANSLSLVHGRLALSLPREC